MVAGWAGRLPSWLLSRCRRACCHGSNLEGMTTLRAAQDGTSSALAPLAEMDDHRFDVLAEEGGQPATEASYH